jgi:hypothetical protein
MGINENDRRIMKMNVRRDLEGVNKKREFIGAITLKLGGVCFL